MTPEAKAKKLILDTLKDACEALGLVLYFESHAGSPFGYPTLDITGCIGRPSRDDNHIVPHPFAIEVKRFDKPAHPTPRQQRTIRSMRAAGIEAFAICNHDDLSKFMHWVSTL